jgi:hypothetical protein
VLPSQVSVPLQKTLSLHCFGVPEQLPLLQVSFNVQGFPSSQGTVLGVNTQWPVPGSQLSSVHGLSSSQTVCGPATQWPPLHVSVWVQAFPSLHGAVLLVCVQPLEGSQPSSVHGLPSLQSGAGPLTHAPPWQVSPCVHALLSLQLVPFGLAGFEQTPVCASQVPATWHWSEAVQVTGFAPVQLPPWQVSVCVQAFPSLHAVPSLIAGFEQTPVVGSHVPASWH